MNNQNSINDVLLAKYLDGATTDKENAVIEHWIGLSMENKRVFEQFENIWLQSKGLRVNTELSFDKKQAFKNVISLINIGNSKADNKPKSKIIKLSTYFARVAAVFIIGVSSYFIYQYFISNAEDYQDLIRNTDIKQEYISADSSFILLPDKSNIYLNTNGTVQYAKNFTENRVVLLKGEAFFEVTKLEGKPFVVKTSDFEVKVLGTSFYISPGPNDSIIEVGVTTGRIEVKQKSNYEIVQLKANESVKFNIKTQSFYEMHSLDLNTLFWKTGELEFNEQSLDEVLELLSKAYKTQINFEQEEMRHCIFSGRFSNASLIEILEQLKLNFNIMFTQDSAGNINITGKGCK